MGMLMIVVRKGIVSYQLEYPQNTSREIGTTPITQNTRTTNTHGETRSGIGEPLISEPQVTIDNDIELRNLRVAVSPIQNHTNTLHHGQTNTRAAMNEAFTQQKKRFQEYMDRQTESLRRVDEILSL
ncbi:hypothetical protein CsatA_020756 [Cannabis sativa]